jgi:hypothetical protein
MTTEKPDLLRQKTQNAESAVPIHSFTCETRDPLHACDAA